MIHKTYLALVHGSPNPAKGVDETPIREVRRGGRKRAELGKGRGSRPALTRYEVLASARKVSLITCQPKTGRLHQIRVHMANRGCPVVGDRDYGKRSPLDRSMGRDSHWLHAARLRFQHPRSGHWMEVIAPIPDELNAFLVESGITCPKEWR
jgi:23S rRNA pseudouridine1911/1915/1917 synthase